MAHFIATTGDDVFNGTDGVIDTVDFSTPGVVGSGGVVVRLDDRTPQNTVGLDTFISIENYIGSDFRDAVTITKGTQNDISLGAGDDEFAIAGGVWTADGGAGFDRISAGDTASQIDLIFSYDGAAKSGTLTGGSSLRNFESYWISTGSGNDTFNIVNGLGSIGSSGSSLNGGVGNDTFNIDGFWGLNNTVAGGYGSNVATDIDTLNLKLSEGFYAHTTYITGFEYNINLSITGSGAFTAENFDRIDFESDNSDNRVVVNSLPLFTGSMSLNIDAKGGQDSLEMNLTSTPVTNGGVYLEIQGKTTTLSNIGYYDDFEYISLRLGEGTNVLRLGDEVDEITSWKGRDTVYAGGGNDRLSASFSTQSVIYHGGGGDDQLAGSAYDDMLYGDDGNDTITSSGGSDLIDGGAGTDKAVFNLSRTSATVVSFQNKVWIYDATKSALSQVTNVETFQFYDGTVSAAQIAVFDAARYLASNTDLILGYGYDLGGAADHYFARGIVEHRATTSFDAWQYMAGYADLLSGFRNNTSGATEHYIRNGYAEGRVADGFDAWQYIAGYTDLVSGIRGNETEAARHYVMHGYAEGRLLDNFDGLEYLASNVDLLNSLGSNETAAARHYVLTGFAQGRSLNSFDALEYLASNIDLLLGFGANENAAVEHFVKNGFYEGRDTDSFDAAQYLANYADLAAGFGSDLDGARLHYITNGYFEGRTDTVLV